MPRSSGNCTDDPSLPASALHRTAAGRGRHRAGARAASRYPATTTEDELPGVERLGEAGVRFDAAEPHEPPERVLGEPRPGALGREGLQEDPDLQRHQLL